MHWLNRVLAGLLTSANILRRNENIFVNKERGREKQRMEKERQKRTDHHIGISYKECLALASVHDNWLALASYSCSNWRVFFNIRLVFLNNCSDWLVHFNICPGLIVFLNKCSDWRVTLNNYPGLLVFWNNRSDWQEFLEIISQLGL
jgi:hypothetical protein